MYLIVPIIFVIQKSYEVLTMLDISKNTLQMIRSRKILKCQKVAGLYYYAMEDIQALLTRNK